MPKRKLKANKCIDHRSIPVGWRCDVCGYVRKKAAARKKTAAEYMEEQQRNAVLIAALHARSWPPAPPEESDETVSDETVVVMRGATENAIRAAEMRAITRALEEEERAPAQLSVREVTEKALKKLWKAVWPGWKSMWVYVAIAFAMGGFESLIFRLMKYVFNL